MLLNPEIGPTDTLRGETIRGTARIHRGAVLEACTVDAEGALYGVECVDAGDRWPEGISKVAQAFNKRHSRLEVCSIRGAKNAGVLARWCEVAGGEIWDCGNDAIKVAAPSWIHGLRETLSIFRLGLISLDPGAHSDGIQPWAPTLVEGRVTIDIRPDAGPAYQESGAGIYVEPDFGQCGPIIVRNGVVLLSRNGYCMQVVPKSGTGPSAGLEPFPVTIRGIYLHREDGKHPVNLPVASTVFEGNYTTSGVPVARVP